LFDALRLGYQGTAPAHQTGLEITGLFSGPDGQPHKAGSQDLMLVAEKPVRNHWPSRSP
jgi:hypothetical protein